MVDKLRKFGEFLWLNKERFILVVMVAILCFQVYKVLYPDEKPRGISPVPPRSIDENTEGFTAPPIPPDKPTITISGDYVSLFRRNPFWFFSGRNQRNTNSDSADYEIHLVDIQVTAEGVRRAQLRTATTTQWYTEGAGFEQFRLESIDVDSQTAVVYVESLGREVTLQME